MLSNTNAKLVAALEEQLHGAVPLRVQRCTDMPADAEKLVCAGAQALLLSAGSTFSEHLLELAQPGTPYAYLGGCSHADSWNACSTKKRERRAGS